ncbi:MAG: hypothetical protein KC983_02525, partial [Phycisphaerales bacterium]|nr:hypothetical protein [Phycisphaerales bacterium]
MSPATPTRAMRGRVMLVGAHPRFDELERTLHQETLRASTIYDAIGRLADPPGMLPIATVVIADDELLHGPSQAPEALRRIDPSVQLVLLGQRGGVSPAGFDATFGDGTNLDDLVATIGASLFDEPPQRRSRTETPSRRDRGHDVTHDRPDETPRERQRDAHDTAPPPAHEPHTVEPVQRD